MRGIFIFILGGVAGQFIETNIGQNNEPGVIKLDHVGIAVDDMEESVAFYTETMGFEKTFSLASVEGEMSLMYVRVGENTFLELTPASEYVPAGLTHIGIQVEGMESVKAMVEGRGANPTETRTSGTQAILSYINDPQGIPIELSEYPPDSAQGRALAGEL
jgi:catechol 2,3-dioxygenase-like lactoylglutathione lyase family enzyme